MKKIFLWMSVALVGLFTSCTEDALVKGNGELTTTRITVGIPGNSIATRGATFDDPQLEGMRVCLMVSVGEDKIVYLETKEGQTLTTAKSVTFDVQLVTGKEYNIAAWADFGDAYYTLPAVNAAPVVAMKNAAPVGSDNKYDAYFQNQATTITANSTIDLVLRRPFALVKVNTTDWEAPAVVNAGYQPTKYTTTINVPTSLNVVSGVAANPQDVTFAGDIVAKDGETKNPKELTFDYIFANTVSANLPEFTVAYSNDNPVTSYTFQNIPVQRNYKTNITGNILTKKGHITVSVVPDWEATVHQVDVNDIEGANDAIAEMIGQDKPIMDVNFKSQPNDAGTPGTVDTETGKTAKAILTTPLKENTTLSINVESTTKSLYVGDYESETSTTVQTTGTNAAVVNINVPQSSSIQTLVINAPSKTVYLNGKLISNTGTITNLDVITSMNTMIIEVGQHVGTLTMRQGGLEIHGQVDYAVVPEGHGAIEVRDCENLKETEVYNVLKPYIAPGYVGVKGRTTEGLWDIVPANFQVGDNYFYALSDAVTAVQSGGTISMLRDVNADGVSVAGGKNFTLDFSGHTYYVDGNLAGSTGTKSQCFQLLSGSTIVFQNGTIKSNIASTGINNYANLTLQDITIDMRETSKTGQVSCLQVMNGNVKVLGNTNIYAKENPGTKDAFIAVLSLYWPTYYGDIDVEVNTTGVVKGMLAYASYQCTDLTTVKDHSKFIIINGDFDVTYDMDGISNPGFKICGGTFTQQPSNSLIAEGFQAVKENGKYVIKAGSQYVARIGETLYASLQAAADAVLEGQTIYLINNAAGVKEETSNISYTLDLNGYKSSCSSMDGTLAFWNCHEITINDSKGTGSAYAEAVNGPSGHHGAVSCHGSDLVTINGGRYEVEKAYGAHNVLAVWWGEMVVNDGVFIGDLFTNNQAAALATSTLTINGGFFDGVVSPDEDGTNMSKVIINGGTFTFNPADYMTEGKVCYVDNNGHYVVANSLPAGYVWTASLSGTKTTYFKGTEGPNQAIAAATGVATVTLKQNATVNKQLTSQDVITVVNNGGAYTGQMTTNVVSCVVGSSVDGNATTYYVTAAEDVAYAKIGSRYYLTVADAINACSNNDVIVLTKDVTAEEDLGRTTTKTFVLDLAGHKIEKDFNNQGHAPIYLASGGTCTIRDSQGNGKIVGGNNMTGAIYSENNSTVVVEGGLITNKNSSGQVRSFCVGADGTVIIKGGDFDKDYYFSTSAYFGYGKLLEISGGRFKSAPDAKYIKSGYSATLVDSWYVVKAN